MSSRLSEERPIVITGLGVISPLGVGADAFWEGLQSGKAGFGPVETFEYMPVPVGEVRGFNATKLLTQREHKKGLKAMCREVQMGVVSAKIGLDNSRLDVANFPKDRIGVDFGAN